jgi:nucleotidyltransferase substrate binding protein (TIGR01987 family)
MTNRSLTENFKNLGSALDRLEESLQAPVDDHRFIIDTVIQRFEFCIELFWKNFKNILEAEGQEALSPRQALVKSYHMNWIHDEQLWLDMLNDRNATSHTYKQIIADAIYSRIPNYYKAMRQSYGILSLWMKNNVK